MKKARKVHHQVIQNSSLQCLHFPISLIVHLLIGPGYLRKELARMAFWLIKLEIKCLNLLLTFAGRVKNVFKYGDNSTYFQSHGADSVALGRECEK